MISSTRAIDWSNAGVVGGIPNRTTVCTTLSAGASAAQINSAIAACPSGQVVFLNAGTYNLSSAIDFNNHSNVTLRGAGADKTFLVFSGGSNCFGLTADVCIRNGDNSAGGNPSHTATWTAGYSRAATSITLSSTAGLTAGSSVIALDQNDDGGDTGGVWVCQAENVCATEGPSGAGRNGRSQEQWVLVTGISGNTVTISPGLYMPNWSSSKSPGAFWANTQIRNSGIEDLSLDHSNGGTQSGILMFNTYSCWVSGVRSNDPDRNHVWLFGAVHSTVMSSYMYATQNYASQSYGVEEFGGSDNLILNNIVQHVTAPLISNGEGSGDVWAYNYTINDFYTVSTAWMISSMSLHSSGIDNQLVEGNIGSGIQGDSVHGTHQFITAFRNYFNGWESGKSQQTSPILLFNGSRYFNIVGNVLGKSGYHTGYQDLAPSGSNADQSIFVLGWSGNDGSTSGSVPNDSLTGSSILRWGNYDMVNNAVRFVTSEVPASLSQFANALPSQTLPSSFFLSAKPSWWGSTTWPAIGPDVSGGDISGTGGHAYLTPAAGCYTNTMGGPADGNGSILSFNAGNCYGSSASSGGGGGTTAPNPPSSLNAVVN